jgi:hypothetical protein
MFEIDFGGSQNTGHESGNSLLVAPNRTASAFGKRSDAARVTGGWGIFKISAKQPQAQ